MALEAAFDGGRLTSDGGLPWLAEAEGAVGVCAALAACVPESDRDLASQPTMSRLENAVDRHACLRLAHALVDVYMQQRERDGALYVVIEIEVRATELEAACVRSHVR